MAQMLWCGYSTKDREIVAKRILAKQDNDMTSLLHEGRNLYRSKEERQQQIKTDKATWFHAMGATTTLTVPATKNSRLAKDLREVIKKNPGPKGTTIKVIERPGMFILSRLAVNNPFKTET